jgi:hypothetical protein
MLQTLKGVPDGEIYPVTYQQGQAYDLGPELEKCFSNMGAIRHVIEKQTAGETDWKVELEKQLEEVVEENAEDNEFIAVAPKKRSK